MKITKVEVFPVAIPYPEPYKVAYRAKPAQPDVIVKIYTDQGIVGYGDAVCRPHEGGTLAVTTSVLVNELGPAIIGQNPLQIERLIVDRLGGMDCPWYAALCGIDLALWDIAGKFYNKPVYELLGGAARRTITLTRSIPMKSLEVMVEKAVQVKEAGYKVVTIKIGQDPEEDLKKVKAVKKAVGDLPIEVDGNEGYSIDALKYLREMDPYIVNCEQPLPRWDLVGMAKVTRALDAAVIADQSVLSARNVAMIAHLDAADVVCVKLATFGGITLTKKAVEAAEALGLPCTFGSAHPLGVGAAAIHHFVAATPWVRTPIGYGAPLERLPDDILKEPIKVKNGEVELWDGPGLGVEVDDAKLKKYGVKINVDYDKPVTVAVTRPRPWLTSI
jgi:L-alanine-DL-glutamate epimerase-like enolase superfamily enzyme